ncbi:MAG: hypothetical protein SGARI_000944 [Bacillariaceae sp.]
MVTAYDYPSAVHVARAGIDIVLVGDSVAMVELGFETTQNVGMDTMLHHCQSVKRGLEFAGSGSMLIGDMPFGTYEFEDTDVALRNAYRFVKEGGCDAIKLEVRRESCQLNCRLLQILLYCSSSIAHLLCHESVAVLGHVGLTPQAISVIGGFRAQGRTAIKARQVLDDALRLQDAGCFAVVLECVPANVAAAVTETLEIPTIGIGAGGGTSGQVLVFHDMLGMLSHPHHDQFVPKFCKKYAQVGHMIQEGLSQFKEEVESGEFPGEEYSPYVMTDGEKEAFDALLQKDADERQLKHDLTHEKLTQADEYETLSLYGAGNGDKKKP